MNWVALGLWVGIPTLVIIVFAIMAKGSPGLTALFFAEVLAIIGYIYTLTSSVAIATNQIDDYKYPYRDLDDYLFDLRFGITSLAVALGIIVYSLLPSTSRGKDLREAEIQRIHDEFNRRYPGSPLRGESWRNKRRLLAGQEARDPIDMTLGISILVVVVIGLVILFVSTVFA